MSTLLRKYERTQKLGKGTYGEVWKAKNRETGKIVAIKYIFPGDSDAEGVPATSIREIALLKEVSRHRNIVQLYEVFCENSQQLSLVFEYLDKDLKGYMNSFKGPMDPNLVKSYMYQLLLGMNFCHMHRVMHRDLKPQNLLIDSTGLLKIADFGLARAFSIPLPQYTHEVVTLWYRAPEVLLGVQKYSTPLDVWSIGAIFAEMANKKPFLPGDSEYDQLMKTFMVFGTPDDTVWPGVSQLRDYKATFPKFPAKSLKDKLPLLEPAGLDLLSRMMLYEPCQRISTKQALKSPYFEDIDKSLYQCFE